MSRPRFTQLDLLQESIDRLLTMVEELPYTKTKKEADDKEIEEMSQNQWNDMVFRDPKKIKPTDEVPTTYFILDEFDRLWELLNNFLMLSKRALANEKLRADASSNEKKNISIAADDILPFTVTFMPNDTERLKGLLQKIDMLYTIIEKCKKDKDPESSQHKLPEIHYAITTIDSAIRIAIEQKNKKPTVEIENNNQVAESKEQFEKIEADKRKEERNRQEDEKVKKLREQLAKIDANRRYDINYSREKYSQFLTCVNRFTGNTNAASVNASANTGAGAGADASQEPEPKLPDKNAKEYQRLSRKQKVIDFFKIARTINNSKESMEFIYDLLLLALITTMGNTSEKGFNISSAFFRPSLLKIKIQSILTTILNKKLDDSLIDLNLYRIKTAPQSTIDNSKKIHSQLWFTDVTTALFSHALKLTNSPKRINLLANVFYPFLEIKNIHFRNEILTEMHNQKILDPILETTFPVASIREDIIKKLKLPTFPKDDAVSPNIKSKSK